MNKLDFLLIYELQEDPRVRNTELAKKFNVSEASIRSHITNLVSSGTLMITALPNTFMLGHRMRAILLFQIEIPQIPRVGEQLKQYHELHYVGICSGSSDMIAIGYFTSNEHLAKFVMNILTEIPGIIGIDTKVELINIKFTWGRLQPGVSTPFGKLIENNTLHEQSDSYLAVQEPTKVEIDQLNHMLIIELQKNSRRSNRSLAKTLGVTETTVRRRLRELIEEGLIELTAVPDPAKIGYLTHGFLQLKVELAKITTIAKELAQCPDIHYLALCAGENLLFATTLHRSPSDYSNFITNVLGNIPGIIRSDTTAHLKYVKRTLGWLQPDQSKTVDI